MTSKAVRDSEHCRIRMRMGRHLDNEPAARDEVFMPKPEPVIPGAIQRNALNIMVCWRRPLRLEDKLSMAQWITTLSNKGVPKT